MGMVTEKLGLASTCSTTYFEPFDVARSLIFRYAIATGRASRDIPLDLRGALTVPKVNHRAAITDPDELGALLRAISGYMGQPTTRLALQLSALLFVRPGELRLARWHEIDLEKAVWIVPPETMKMKRPHRVPLA